MMMMMIIIIIIATIINSKRVFLSPVLTSMVIVLLQIHEIQN